MKRSKDAVCAKLISKKSSGHLRISVLIFLFTVTVVMVLGLLYARQYFQYKKDFTENLAMKTVRVDANFCEDTVQPMHTSDISVIESAMQQDFPNSGAKVIPVYTCAGIYKDGAHINLYAIEKGDSFFIGLEQMLDDTAYFLKKQPETVMLEVSVLKEVAGGFSSEKIKPLRLQTDDGVSEKTPVLSTLMPGMKEDLTCFVNMETFRRIISAALEENAETVAEAESHTELITISDIYVYAEDLQSVNTISEFLSAQNYRAYTPTDAFDDFNETISVTYTVFLLSSIILLCIATVNIFLSFRSFYRVQQKDIGILKYMGFHHQRIYKMYCRNLSIQFLRILLICAGTTFVFGMIVFSFAHWDVLLSFILLLFVFLSVIYLVVCRCIVYHYIKRDFLFLIRESKEFE